ncbi:MAG: riboflavin synthase [Chloroflexia bacterium]|nr:riboflavin synthase [Chloroflexia bacterium]
MFTGLIEEIGLLRRRLPPPKSGLSIESNRVLQGTRIGDSIAVNGVCLTVTNIEGDLFTVDVMPETLRQSNLGRQAPGSRLNLERAMPATGRLDGHLVQGHVDGQGEILSKRQEGNALWVTIAAGPEIVRYLVPRAFIAIDGASLTVARVEARQFAVSLIPHTQAQITLGDQPAGYRVNLEVDVIAKYVERLLQRGAGSGPEGGRLDRGFLTEHGYV